MHPEFEAQFLDWLHPLEPEFFRGKRVLDAGCGTGRHAYFAATYGATRGRRARPERGRRDGAREPRARSTTCTSSRATSCGRRFARPPSGGGFDLIYSIGVLHHLPDPHAGFRALVRFLRPGGTIAVWVYGHENNGFVRNVVEPMRRVSTRIPPPAPARPRLAARRRLPRRREGRLPTARADRGRAARSRSTTTWRASPTSASARTTAIVFDQLVAPTAAYISGPELASWFAEAGLEDVQISHRHGNSWRGRGRAPASG